MKHFHLDRAVSKSFLIVSSAIWLGTGSLSGVKLYTTETEEPELKRTDVVISYGEISFDSGSNEAAFQARHGLRDSGTGGLERFYWEDDESGDWRTYVDSRWVLNPDETGVRLEIHNRETVFFDLNFQHWKQYDDVNGPWFPPTDTFAVLSAEAFEKEINKLDLSLRIHTTDLVRVELQYGFFNRKGTSLSTRFGDDFQYQIGGTPSRGIIPALIESDEEVHTFGARLIRQDGPDQAGLRLHYQRRTADQTRVVERAALQPSANRFTTQEESSTDDLFAASGFNRQELSDTLVGSIGFAFTRLDGDITGSRIFGASPEAAFDVDFPALQLYDRGYLDLENSRTLKQWIFNGNLVYTPSETMRWMTGVRLEHLSTEAFSSYLDVHSTVDWTARAFQVEVSDMISSSEKSALDISGFLEGRYSGINHALIYSRVEVSHQSGDLDESWSRQELSPDTGTFVDLLDRVTDFDRLMGFWKTGINYYPKAGLRLSLEGYLKYRENSYDWKGVTQPAEDFTLYPGHITEQAFRTRAVNARVHWTLLKSLKSVSRVDYQVTTINTDNTFQSSINSSERERLVFNQSLTWTPSGRFFATAGFNYVEDLTKSGAAGLEGTFGGIIVNIPNDYWQANLNLYFVLSKLIDIQVNYQYTEMSNFVDNSAMTVPFGTDLTEHYGSVQLVFNISERARARLGYHVYDRDEPSTGGFRDYTVHLVKGSFQLIF